MTTVFVVLKHQQQLLLPAVIALYGHIHCQTAAHTHGGVLLLGRELLLLPNGWGFCQQALSAQTAATSDCVL
jgi:hypothetical protein